MLRLLWGYKAWILCDLSYVEHMLRDFPHPVQCQCSEAGSWRWTFSIYPCNQSWRRWNKIIFSGKRCGWKKSTCVAATRMFLCGTMTFFLSDWLIWAKVPCNLGAGCHHIPGRLKSLCVQAPVLLEVIFLQKDLTCLFFDFTENAEECWFHSVTVQSMFPVSVWEKIKYWNKFTDQSHVIY